MSHKDSVAIVGIVGVPGNYGGFETLAENLIDSDLVDFHVFCSARKYTQRNIYYKNARLTYLPIDANGVSSVLYDIVSLFICLFTKPSAVLILGVSGCLFLPIFRLLSSAKVITNIDGLEWKRDKWGGFARLYLRLSEYFAVKFSHVVVSDNQAISDYVKSSYRKEAITIAYGGDHAIPRRLTVEIDDYFLSVCRIEPENNVGLILDAFSKSRCKLKFIGNWKSSKYGLDLVEKYSKFSHIELLDPIYDINVLFDFRDKCAGYVHGHSAGGTNPSLVEAMHFGKDIYAFDCSYNRHTTCNKAYYFSDSDNLLEALNDSTKIKNGRHMKEIAQEKYLWEIIRLEYIKLLKIN